MWSENKYGKSLNTYTVKVIMIMMMTLVIMIMISGGDTPGGGEGCPRPGFLRPARLAGYQELLCREECLTHHVSTAILSGPGPELDNFIWGNQNFYFKDQIGVGQGRRN